ncbi:trigger factor [Larkinella terrae]|uniref:Trigger factor n=1 Tax=Larkinella terrae TaxID=2025311 RepID=A0A7K0EVD2_9BACT|nr:trigger factor [Larkinella terrae]MRS65516.1 trigger factor [Larkinella terrae]
MEIALEKSTETNASLRIKLSKSDYQPEVDKKLKDYGRRASIKGFRPGKVPSSLIQKMYGKSVLVEEINELLKNTVNNYIRDNKLQVVGDPLPDREQADAIDWDSQNEFEFNYNLGLASDFEVDFDAIPAVSAYEIEAGETELNSTIDELKTRFSGQTNVDESAEGDMIYGELKQPAKEEGGEPFSTKTAFPTKQIAAEELPKFVGLKKGDTVTFDIEQTFPDEKSRGLATGLKKEEAAELAGEFTFTVDDITRPQQAEIGQEFFDKVLGPNVVDNEEQFREKVLEVIKGNYARESDTLQRLDIEQALLDNISISLPDDFLKQWLLATNEGKVSEQEVEEQYDAFARSVKLQLIKNKIASENEINVAYEDVLNATRGMVREQFGFYGDDEQMSQTIDKIAQQYLMDDKGENYMKMYNRMSDDKVIDVIKSKLTLTPRTVTVDEFKELVTARQPV